MIKSTVFALSVVALTTVAATPAHAQAAMQSQARPGSYGNASRTTNNFRRADSIFTTSQRLASVPMAGLGGVAPIHGNARGRNGLPQTSLDSFVLNAGGAAELIYGDEGAVGPPPYEEFTAGHRIQAGIQGNASGLTTGHGSYLPCAWGGDEFVDGPEFSFSAPSGGGNYWANQVPVGQSPGTRPDMTGEPYEPPTTDDPPANNNQQDYDTSGF